MFVQLQNSFGASCSLVLILLICTGHLSSCLESPQPEVLLQPRNFNPHPYQEGVRVSPTAAGRLGPVLFPQGVGGPINRHSALSATLLDTSVDYHPYANVARKHRIKLAGRFSSAADDQVTNATCVNANTRFLVNSTHIYRPRLCAKRIVKALCRLVILSALRVLGDC